MSSERPNGKDIILLSLVPLSNKGKNIVELRFDTEDSLSNPLLKAKNCIITPHMSWAAVEARGRIVEITAGNIRAFLDGKRQNVVNP